MHARKIPNIKHIDDILRAKNLAPDLFSGQLALKADIHLHAAWAYRNIYSVKYNNHQGQHSLHASGIARYSHGIMHTASTAIYVPALVNLYRRYHDMEAIELSDEDIKLLQIAALWHDAAREDDGEDKWDHESALMLYFYLTKLVGVSHAKAKLVAEAIANKDPHKQGYFAIHETSYGYEPRSNYKKNIYQKIIHDTDCLDVMRARPHFEGSRMDFYDSIAQHNPDAMYEMSQLICEVRSFIELRGDTFWCTTNHIIKEQFETEGAYNHLKTLLDDRHPILSGGQARVNGTSLETLMRAGEVMARGVRNPTRINTAKAKKVNAAVETSKVTRLLGQPYGKRGRKNKDCNKDRSLHMLMPGCSLYLPVGYLVFNPPTESFTSISLVDAHTSIGKEKIIKHRLTHAEVLRQLPEFKKQLMLGGASTKVEGYDAYFTHNECTMNISKFDAVYYSNDRSPYIHHHVSFLRAVYLQISYENAYDSALLQFRTMHGEDKDHEFIARFGDKRTLPIYCLSQIHNTSSLVPAEKLRDEYIIQCWIEMCRKGLETYISSQEDIVTLDFLERFLGIEVLKIIGEIGGVSPIPVESLDSIYSATLRAQLNVELQKSRRVMIDDYQRFLQKYPQLNKHYLNTLQKYDVQLFEADLEGSLALYLAALTGDLTELASQEKLFTIRRMNRALDMAVNHGHIVVAIYLIEKGANPFCKQIASNKDELLINYIITKDYSTLLQSVIVKMGSQYLHASKMLTYAIENGAVNCARVLLATYPAGVLTSDFFTNHLRNACSSSYMLDIGRSPAMLEFLLESGAQLNYVDAEGNHVLFDIAKSSMKTPSINFLMTKIDKKLLTVSNHRGVTPLQAALYGNELFLSHLLLEDTLIQEGSLDDSEKYLESLVKAMARHLPVSSPLLNRKILKSGGTILHVATRFIGSSDNLMRALIKKGADPAVTNNCGETPLRYALNKTDTDIFRQIERFNAIICLLEYCDASIYHSSTTTASIFDCILYDLSQQIMVGQNKWGHDSITKSLQNSCKVLFNRNDIPCRAIDITKVKSVEALLEILIPAIPDSLLNSLLLTDGSTLLHMAIQCGSELHVEALLKRGSQPGSINSEGQTALEYAAMKQASHFIMCILKDPSQKPFVKVYSLVRKVYDAMKELPLSLSTYEAWKPKGDQFRLFSQTNLEHAKRLSTNAGIVEISDNPRHDSHATLYAKLDACINILAEQYIHFLSEYSNEKTLIARLNDTVDSFDDNYPRLVSLILRNALETKKIVRGSNMPEPEVLLLESLKGIRKPAVRTYKY